MRHATGSRSQMQALQAHARKLFTLPQRGQHVGGGRHVDMPATYTPGAPGWTAEHAAIRRHPTTPALWAFPISGSLVAAMASPTTIARLNASERSVLLAGESSAIQLDSGWDPPAPSIGKP